MSAVQIPNPCHEDWNLMTPTERGAFCKKCSVDVIDFTIKSNTEIKSILRAEGKSICGHIKPSQMESLNREFTNWKNQSKKTFQSKFLLACVLVFGMTLFTGCQEEVPYIAQQNQTEITTEQTENAINAYMEMLATKGQNVDPEFNEVRLANLFDLLESLESQEIGIGPNPHCDDAVDGGLMVDPEYFDYLDKEEK